MDDIFLEKIANSKFAIPSSNVFVEPTNIEATTLVTTTLDVIELGTSGLERISPPMSGVVEVNSGLKPVAFNLNKNNYVDAPVIPIIPRKRKGK